MKDAHPFSSFEEVNHKFIALQTALRNGTISNETFQQEVQKLVLTDQQGVSWWLGYEGRWYRHNGQQWVPYESVSPSPAFKQTAKPAEDQKPRRIWPWIVIPGIAIFLCLSIALVVIFVNINQNNRPGLAEEQPTEQSTAIGIEPTALPGVVNPAPATNGAVASMVEYSNDQQTLLNDFGNPDAFTILQIEDSEGNAVRYETWVYFQGNTSFIFSDGAFQIDGEVEPLPEGYIQAPYTPDQFPLGTSPEQIQDVLGEYPLTAIENADDFLEGLQLYGGEQLILGFKDQQLAYVESLVFIPEGSEQ